MSSTSGAAGPARRQPWRVTESDFLKESFKGVGKIATTELKLNASVLFGEEDVDVFARQLRDQFHRGVQALTDAIAAHKLTDKELITTFLAYDVEYTTESEYVQTLRRRSKTSKNGCVCSGPRSTRQVALGRASR